MAILITCTCGKLQHVPNSYEGRVIRCLYCEKPLRVVLNMDEVAEEPEKIYEKVEEVQNV